MPYIAYSLHDLEAQVGDRVGLMFDGEVISEYIVDGIELNRESKEIEYALMCSDGKIFSQHSNSKIFIMLERKKPKGKLLSELDLKVGDKLRLVENTIGGNPYIEVGKVYRVVFGENVYGKQECSILDARNQFVFCVDKCKSLFFTKE